MTSSVLVLFSTLSVACTMSPLDDTFGFRPVDEGFTVMLVGRPATSFFWAEADFGWSADRSGPRGAHGGRVGAAFCAASISVAMRGAASVSGALGATIGVTCGSSLSDGDLDAVEPLV